MRKEYRKPELFAESFRLLEHIASVCDNARYHSQSNFVEPTSCSFVYDGEALFTSYVDDCASVRDAEDIGPFDCYNAMTFQVMAFQTS